MAIEVNALPGPFVFEPSRTALVIIDMQRDFIEPGGFGDSLGNDVSLLAEIVPVVAEPLGRRAGAWCIRASRMRRISPIARLRSGCGACRGCASAIRGRWAAF